MGLVSLAEVWRWAAPHYVSQVGGFDFVEVHEGDSRTGSASIQSPSSGLG